MVSHLLFGGIVFSLVGWYYDFAINLYLFLIGAFIGIAPDLLTFLDYKNWKMDRYSYLHRDGFAHSIFFPFITHLITILFFWKIAADMVLCTLLTHPILDLFGIGWGVKMFYPLSHKTYKMFYKGKIFWIFKPDELEREVEVCGVDDWFVRIIKRQPVPIGLPMWVIKFEWICFILFVACCIYLFHLGPAG